MNKNIVEIKSQVKGSFSVEVSGNSQWTIDNDVLVGDKYIRPSSVLYTFALGAVVGNLTELGIASSSNDLPSTKLHTRALFKDGAGDPTTVTVTALDQLVVTYVVQKSVPMAPVSSSITADVNGVATDIAYTIYPYIASNTKGATNARFCAGLYEGQSNLLLSDKICLDIDPITFTPTKLDNPVVSSAPVTDVIEITSTGNTFTSTFAIPLDQSNFTWKSLILSDFGSIITAYGYFQLVFDGPNYITKTGSDVVTLSVVQTMQQETS